MKSPWMKFYPADWRADPCLRMCSLAARGLWMEMLAIMHEASPRGHLIIGKSGVSPRQLAGISSSSLKEVNRLLTELESAGVFSREGEIIISRRMLRDEMKAERDRLNGLKGGNPDLVGVNPDHKAQMLDARDQSQKEELSLPLPPPERESEDQSEMVKMPTRWAPGEAVLDEAIRLGLTAAEIARLLTRFKNHARQGARKCAGPVGWDAAFANWCDQAAERLGRTPGNDHSTTVERSDKVFVREGTEQWDAWEAYLKATTGKGSPRDKTGGWHRPSEWPPADATAQVH